MTILDHLIQNDLWEETKGLEIQFQRSFKTCKRNIKVISGRISKDHNADRNAESKYVAHQISNDNGDSIGSWTMYISFWKNHVLVFFICPKTL